MNCHLLVLLVLTAMRTYLSIQDSELWRFWPMLVLYVLNWVLKLEVNIIKFDHLIYPSYNNKTIKFYREYLVVCDTTNYANRKTSLSDLKLL
jgi:hypothetical protein